MSETLQAFNPIQIKKRGMPEKKSGIPRPSPPRPGTEPAARHGVPGDAANALRMLAQEISKRKEMGKSGTYTKEEELRNQRAGSGSSLSTESAVEAQQQGFVTPTDGATPERPGMVNGVAMAPPQYSEATEVRRQAQRFLKNTSYLIINN